MSATSAATTVEGTVVECQPVVLKPAMEICSGVAFIWQEDWRVQLEWRNSFALGSGDESAERRVGASASAKRAMADATLLKCRRTI